MNSITAILLAAGLSRRFGADNKLLAEIDGEAMVGRVAGALCASRAQPVLAVLGHQADQVAAVLSGLALQTIINPDYRQGRVSSVRAGLAAIGDEAAGFMMCLADQPLLKAADYDALIDAFADQPDRILVPFIEGKRGNPVVFPMVVRDAVLNGGDNLSCRDFMDANPQLIRRLDVTNPAYGIDFDTPEAFQN